MERPAILNRSMPRTPDVVIGSPPPRTTNVSVPKTKIYEANLHSFRVSRRSIADAEQNVKGEGMPYSKILSIFDHVVRNSSTIESNYQELALATMGTAQEKG